MKYSNSILLFLFILIETNCVAQTQTINEYNQNGKREGLWLLYLDKTWAEVKDTNTATFKAYDKFINGFALYAGLGHKIKYRLEGLIDSTHKFLNGTYKWYNKKNRLKYEYTFIKGEIVGMMEYARNGDTNYFDYRLMYKNEIYTYSLQMYNAQNQHRHFFIFRNGYKGWRFYEWDKNDPNIVKRNMGNLNNQASAQ